MRKQDIEIVIAPNGDVSFTVKGIKGGGCIAETKFLEEALGGAVVDQQKTGEYFEQSEGYVSTWAGEGGGEGGDE
ncbi:MAG: DUF2997 domain-containing protein [Kofleriaceae bacterium]|nr:DUF2997 domain-containing protein [Kofleriaceae bacterium]MCL4227753.1 DUF2997 domain-containing protein [Myxococcales bacterium]